jgi:hypothetical protein
MVKSRLSLSKIMVSSPIQSFRKAISPFLDDWDSIDLRVIAYKTLDGKWVFGAIRAILDPLPISTPTTMVLPSVPNLFVTHKRWEVARIDELLHSLFAGELKVDNEGIKIGGFEKGAWKPSTSQSFFIYRRESSQLELGIDSAAYFFQIYENMISGVDVDNFIAIQGGLISSTEPLDGLAELRQEFIGLSRDSSNPNRPVAEVIAPLGVSLNDQTRVDGTNLEVFVNRTPRTSVNKVGVSAIAYTGKGISRQRRPSLDDEGNEGGTLRTTLEIPGDFSRLKVIVTYKGFQVDRREFFGKGFTIAAPRIAVVQNLGGGVARLDEMLSAKGKDFEDRITILFHLLGFNPVHYGAIDGEVPDVVVFSDIPGLLLVVECTGREIDNNNKLTKLVNRTNEIARVTENLRAIPVIITPLPRSDIGKSELEKAGKEKIVVITKDEILRLIQMAIEGSKQSETLQFLSRLVPAEDPTKS